MQWICLRKKWSDSSDVPFKNQRRIRAYRHDRPRPAKGRCRSVGRRKQAFGPVPSPVPALFHPDCYRRLRNHTESADPGPCGPGARGLRTGPASMPSPPRHRRWGIAPRPENEPPRGDLPRGGHISLAQGGAEGQMKHAGKDTRRPGHRPRPADIETNKADQLSLRFSSPTDWENILAAALSSTFSTISVSAAATAMSIALRRTSLTASASASAIFCSAMAVRRLT